MHRQTWEREWIEYNEHREGYVGYNGASWNIDQLRDRYCDGERDSGMRYIY